MVVKRGVSGLGFAFGGGVALASRERIGVARLCGCELYIRGSGYTSNRMVGKSRFLEVEEKGSAHEKLGSLMSSSTDSISRVSSSAMMSAKWYSRASLSFDR